ncbi:hypothetical protein AWENTII_009379 [Aspergillus wentii]
MPRFAFSSGRLDASRIRQSKISIDTTPFHPFCFNQVLAISTTGRYAPSSVSSRKGRMFRDHGSPGGKPAW